MALDVSRCTAREVLAVALPACDFERHALDRVECVASDEIRFFCRCGARAIFFDEAVKVDFGSTVSKLFARLGVMGYVR
jgi:hypothetical protein